MAPKKDKSGSAKSKGAEEDQEDALQAVVIADTFETRFAPLTLERPRCLLPLANVPLIEYTLEYLANAGVQDVFLYGGAHTDQVEKYIEVSKWKLPTSPFKKFVFLRSMATSVGDVMRDLDGKNFITSDFLAVSGDIISNFPIEDALNQHRARRDKDRNAIMTMLLREGNKTASTSTASGIPTFVIDPSKDRCLHYEEVRPRAQVHIDPDVLRKEPEIDIRQDLIDCRIDICTPDVLSLWSDNFDNQSPRKEFLYGVLKDYELNGKTIHTYIIKEHYAARVANLPYYDLLTGDIASRWTYPICPDSNLLPWQHFHLRKGHNYQENGVILSRSCVIGNGCLIGSGSSVGDRSVIKDVVIGRGCQIGKDVQIDGAYIWDNATIGDGTRITKALVADEATIGDRCTIDTGAVLSFGVRISSDIHITHGTMITKAPVEDGASVPNDKDVVGANGEGYQYLPEEEVTPILGSKGSQNSFYSIPEYACSNSSLSSAASSDVSDAESDSFTPSRKESFLTDVSDDSVDGVALERFHHEAVVSLYERMQSNTDPEDVRVELMGLRFSNNSSEHQVRRAVATALMKHIQSTIDATGPSAAVASVVTTTLKRYQILIQREGAEHDVEDQVEFMLASQKDLCHRAEGERILLFVAKDLYDREVFGEEVFIQWWHDERSSATEEMQKVRETTRQFIEWLENAEEESSEEEDED
ncbi:putative translation initiation factor eif-2b epsilon [Phaeomoniella chlamydospora]|uniref:Mannose-1-phosphate guanyltransferase n=1 Tax=Phaeomoniella chlamydospora TaxID=158046 RepID=A0A0G2GUF3_PHACM|nr:putative translation initiation factor eif-2b epsilon [Phaeomoniella chlamydospora]